MKNFNELSNIMAGRYNFLSRKQRQDETWDEFATPLILLVTSCNYEKPQIPLRDQFVLHIFDDHAREKLLDEAQKDANRLTFQRAVNLIKNFEATKQQKNNMK